jgi:hypothetical protein
MRAYAVASPKGPCSALRRAAQSARSRMYELIRPSLDSKHPVMRSLLLFLPRTLRVDADDAVPLDARPAWRRLLSRARATRFARQDLEAALLQSFGVQRQRDWPVAPFTWLADGGSGDQRFWLRADPVHLRAERDALVLVDASRLKLEGAAADSLVDSLNAHFDADELRFHAPAPARWYVSLPQAPDIATCPLPDVVGRSVDPLLPHGKDALTWHRRSNEVQMLLHEHPTNQAREAAGESSINSVWFWGGGTLPKIVHRAFACVWGDDPLARGLALAARLPSAPAPDHARQWLEQATDGEHLLVFDALSAEGAEALRALEESWFAPLLQALKVGQLTRLSLMITSGEDWLRLDVASGDLWKFWRRAPALMS